MKRFLSVFLAVLFLHGVSAAESGTSVVYHEIFGLSEGASPEEVRSAVESAFSCEPSRMDENVYTVDNRFLYDVPVDSVSVDLMDFENNPGKKFRSVTVEFKPGYQTPECFYNLYLKLTDLYGAPTVFRVSDDMKTADGIVSETLDITDFDAVQGAFDRGTLTALVCWDNISLRLKKTVTPMWTRSSIWVRAAFSDFSLESDVMELYHVGYSKDK